MGLSVHGSRGSRLAIGSATALVVLLLSGNPASAGQQTLCCDGCPVAANDAIRLSLAQISITIPRQWPQTVQSERLGQFRVALTLVRSCDELPTIANAFGGAIVTSDRLTWRDLPVAMRDDLEPKPIGTPSAMFGEEGRYSVLVRCG